MLYDKKIAIEHKDIEYRLWVWFWFEEDLNKGTGSQYGSVDYYNVETVKQISANDSDLILHDLTKMKDEDDEFHNTIVEKLKLIREESKDVASREV